MWQWGQLHKSSETDGSPVDTSLLMDSTSHVPNNEVVVIAVCYPKTMSEIQWALVECKLTSLPSVPLICQASHGQISVVLGEH
jgi:hypothetical protein